MNVMNVVGPFFYLSLSLGASAPPSIWHIHAKVFNDDFIVSDHFGGVEASSLYDDSRAYEFDLAVKSR